VREGGADKIDKPSLTIFVVLWWDFNWVHGCKLGLGTACLSVRGEASGRAKFRGYVKDVLMQPPFCTMQAMQQKGVCGRDATRTVGAGCLPAARTRGGRV
jgi:hypothetical protein